MAPELSWHQARCVATHPRIAEAARAAGFAVVCESRPAMADLIASIESLA
jgi:uroporphyrinogen-III synthase